MLRSAEVLTLALINPGNHCYFNSVIQALAWTISHCEQGYSVANLDLGRLLLWLHRKPQRVSLWDMRPWRQLLGLWSEPHRQHDASELLHHLYHAFTPASERQVWHARVEIAADEATTTQVMDRGHLWPMMIAVPLNASGDQSSISLQSLIVQWRNQASRHAVDSASHMPILLPVQIHRFRADGSKLHTPLQWGEAVYVPAFTGDGLHTTSSRYIVDAVVFHLGESVHQGHYRAVLASEGAIRYITEDGITAYEPTEAEVRTAQQNSYLFFLRRADSTVVHV